MCLAWACITPAIHTNSKVVTVEDLIKSEVLQIRISLVQKEWLAEAARIVSAERGEAYDLSTLAREFIVAGAETVRARGVQQAA